MTKKSNKLVMKYKLNKNRRLVGGSIKAKQFKRYKKKKSGRLSLKKKIYRKKNRKSNKKKYKGYKKNMKGGFIKIPFIGGNNNQQVLINAMCNQLDETELNKHPRKVDAFVKSLCPNSSYNQNSIGGANNSGSGGIFGMVKNLGYMATSPIRGLLNSLNGNQQQQALNNQLLMNNQLALNNQQSLNNQQVLNNQANTQANTLEKSQSNAQINNNIESPKKTQSAGSLKKKIKLPKL